MPILRPVTPADLDAIHATQARAEAHDEIPYRTPREEFAEWLTDPDLNLAADTRVVEVDGRIAAWARVWHRPSGEREERCYLLGDVAPEFRGRGIGRALLAWQIERGREVLRAAISGLPGFVRAQGYDFRRDRLRLYERAGMRPVRYMAEMLRDLEELPVMVAEPGISISVWDRALDEEARQVMNAAFMDHWGSTPRSPQAWQHELESHASRLDLSFLAFEAGQVVGATRSTHFPGDEAATGRRDGWVSQVGVLRSHRKRGIASALIAASLAAFHRARFTHAALGVDSENPTGALGLYEQLGFRVRHRAVVYQIEG